MTTLTRAQTKAALTSAAWPAALLDVMVAVAAAESSLRVDVTGPPNTDGSVDYGLLQINSRYVTGDPHYDRNLLLSDAVYNCRAAHDRYVSQGLGAWAAYSTGRYLAFMPPPVGPAVAPGSAAWFLVHDLQVVLNAHGASPALATDGDFGPLTEQALVAFQAAHPLEAGVVGAGYWKALGL